MDAGTYTFGPFHLDPADRRLTRDGAPIEVSARYLDALILLAAEGGRLVTKDRFMDEVWRGVPVTDEALTQCIRSLRRALDDDAASPRYIETVPRHGYRLIAPLGDASTRQSIPPRPASIILPGLLDTLAAALGGGMAGVVGALGLIALGLVTPGIGTASTLMVLVTINLLLGTAGGAAVGGGIALAGRFGGGLWRLALGGAAGGVLVGAIGRMVGHDLFALLFGQAPGAITGAFEGLVVGAATGLAFALALTAEGHSPARRLLPGFVLGGIAGAGIALTGGRLMAGSLAELAARFPGSNLEVGGALFGESGFGPIALTVATAAECALFTGGVVVAMTVARRLRSAR